MWHIFHQTFSDKCTAMTPRHVRFRERFVEKHQLFRVQIGLNHFGKLTSFELLSRIGDITRFKTADSLANYFGLTPGCRNSGKATQRLGGITKAGSSIARRILNHAVVHVTRKCENMKAWHKKIKTRRGAKTARVAVMRRLATIVWHILRWDKTYQFPCNRDRDISIIRQVRCF